MFSKCWREGGKGKESGGAGWGKKEENKRQKGGNMQKNWALLDRMTLPKRGGGEVAVGLEELWMSLPLA